MMRAIALLVTITGLPAWALAAAGPAANAMQVLSPDGSVQFSLFAKETGLNCAVTFRNKPVIETSALRILVDGTDLTESAEIGEVARYEIDET